MIIVIKISEKTQYNPGTFYILQTLNVKSKEFNREPELSNTDI